jgi:thioesterase domain-containing protein
MALTFCWSMGGVAAFEMARQLTHAGERVSHLFLFDSWIPAFAPIPIIPAVDDVSLLASFALDLGRMLGKPFPFSVEELAPLSHEARMNLLIERARSAGTIPQEMGSRELDAIFNVFRAHSRALVEYAPPRDYTGPVSLFRPKQTLPVLPSDPSGGWASAALSPPRLFSLPGDHYSLITDPHVLRLGQLLQDLLEAGDAKLTG